MKLLDKNGNLSQEIFSIIENANDFIFVKNTDFVYTASSRAFAQQCVGRSSAEDVIGKTDYELFTDQKLAAHYREEDERLLAADKDVLEFTEDYIDNSGKKHHCLTTKYLLCNEDGQPAAIFGHYHDLDSCLEVEMAQRNDKNRKAMLAMSRAFFVSNYVDIRANSYITLWAMEYVQNMMKGCDTAEKGFERFIATLVRPDFYDKVREFCRMDTLAQRLKGKGRMDCDYLSRVATGWCRISFMPAEWDEDGEVTHALFTVTMVDDDQAREIEEGRSGQRDLRAIFDEVPGGIVLYRWDGKDLKVLKMSRFYKDSYGYSMLNDTDVPNFERIHPDDVEGYRKAIMHAVTETHRLEYVFRVWDAKKKGYGWTQINAVSKPQEDGTSYVYAMYTDVTEQKIAELRLKKSNASIMTILGAAEQFNYEYDPVEHTSTCFTVGDNGYHLDRVIHDYPECFRTTDFMHPDDVELFIETVHKIDNGAENAHCTIRANKDGHYHYHSCTFDAFYDSEKERRIALLTVVDVTPNVVAKRAYESRLQMISRANSTALCMCDVNITQNRFGNVQAKGVIQRCAEEADTLDAFILNTSKGVFDPAEQRKYLKLFKHENLLKLFDQGESRIYLEHFYRVDATHTEWVETVFDLAPEPTTGDVVGICYAKSVNKQNMDRILLEAALAKDYPMAALVYADTGEYFYYETENSEYCSHRQDYWGTFFARLEEALDGEELKKVRRSITKENVLRVLETQSEFSYAFYSTVLSERCRLEARFRYVDREHNLLLATLRNITDGVLYRQYKYDSEHDALTGLLNRHNVFAESRRMLEAHPEKQYMMVHCDVRRFHLYNSFFGEEAGDRLLRHIAHTLQSREADYSAFTCGRIESDVFCAFFPIEDGLFEKHIRMSLRDLKTFSPDFPLSLAIGAYRVTDASLPMESMFTRATIAAKADKRNLFGEVTLYDDEMERQLADTQQITGEMTAAVEQEQFKVYLQPKYTLRSEKLVGAEALVRWQHPQRGMVSPGAFIPLFEQNGFITNLDRYMWEHVCKILRKWQDEGREMVPISVNISRVSMYSPSTVPFLKSLIEKYRLEPKYLELELTETAYMDDPEDLKRMLKQLQDYGFRILMDDFGNGYSSLNTLRELPVDMLKLDMRFLTTTQEDSRALAVLTSVVRMSKLLKLPIVAEGVENREQADYLRSIGCEYVQGYLFARPMPVEAFEKLPINSEALRVEQTAANAPAENGHVVESHASMGVLEYSDGKFAYINANKHFLKEFELIENLRPASIVFREHLDDENYKVLLRAFAHSSETEQEAMFVISWNADDGSVRKYRGLVSYNGMIGTYADLSVCFVNITDIAEFKTEEAANDEASAETEHYTANAAEMVRAIDNTGIRMFMYFPQTKTITVPGKTCAAYGCAPFYDNMPHSFADDYVHPDDYPVFKEMYYKIDRGESSADALFHSKDFQYCNHVTLTTVSWTEDGKPKDVFGLIEDQSEQYRNEQFIKALQGDLNTKDTDDEMTEAMRYLSYAISSQFFAVYYIRLDSHDFVCMQGNKGDVMSVIGKSGNYDEAWELYINTFVEEHDRPEMWKFVNMATIAERLRDKNSLVHNYRRRGIGWAQGKFIPAKIDENGKPVTLVYVVSDITAEVENDLRRAKAEEEALHDELTGLFNRKAFAQCCVAEKFAEHPTGLMLFDIDRFKDVNDRYGHETGDKVIKEVCEKVRNALRYEDLVFRMGGDEFAVLLYDCNQGVWNSLCRKIARIHADVRESLDEDIVVTISAGLVLDANGYGEALYALADKALYHTKVNGRGGCTMIDLDGNIVQEWHDSTTVLRKGDILERNSTVTWRMDVPRKEGLPVRAFGDDMFMTFIGLSQGATPEETFNAWFERVEPDNLEIIRESIFAAIKEGTSEVVYKWRHPEKGVVQLRSSASLDSQTEDYYTVVGYIHITTGTHVYTVEDISDRVRSALDELYLCSFYIRLNDDSFKVYKMQPYTKEMLDSCATASGAIDSYIKYMVAEESKAELADFMNLDTIRERMRSENVLSMIYKDLNIGVVRARFIAVDRNEEGLLESVSLVVETL